MPNYYTEDFKREIVALRKGGKSVTELCKEYGLGKNTVAQWVKLFDDSGNVREKRVLTKEQQELKALRKAVNEHEKQLLIVQRALGSLLKKKV